MNALIFLIVFPLVISFLALLPALHVAVRKTIGVIVNLILCAVPVYLLFSTLDQGPSYFRLESGPVDIVMLFLEVLIAVYFVYLSVRSKRYLSVIPVSIPLFIMSGFELASGHSIQVEHSLFMDK